MEYKWTLKTQGNSQFVKNITKELKVNNIIANLLVQRDIITYSEAREFFRPSLKNLHDPFIMKGMTKAVKRIEKAIANKEKILVYGDYDVDGTTAVSLVYSFFKKIMPNDLIDFYIPDRHEEGYGISYKGVDYAASHNFSLIIALDCGIKAISKIDYANGKGIDFIICDHHLPGTHLPKAYAVLDPKQKDCPYPFKELSGCGVGFKLIQAFAKNNGIPFKELETYLDLVVVSIAADIVPITGENRILAYYGLKLINTKPRPAIEAIFSYSNIKKNSTFNLNNSTKDSDLFFSKDISISDLVFMVAPRINAAGRVSDGKASVRLLIENDVTLIKQLAEKINDNNTERRALDSNATEEAIETIATDVFLKNSKSSVILNENWHKGVIGIVASRLTEHYYRPTIVCTIDNGTITGSARSVKDFDIYAAIDHCSDLLEDFGGHKFAAGLSMRPENFLAFRDKFEAFVENNITEAMLKPDIEIDMEIKLKDITPKFFRILKQFAPFGPGNMAPVFLTKGVYEEGFARIVGMNHLKLSLSEVSAPLVHFDAIAFKQADKYDSVKNGFPFNVCYHIDENNWKGNVNLQLNIKDIKLS